MKQKLLISFSGGRTSAYMTKWLLENMQDKYEMIVVFANTGKEKEETLEFAHECDVNFRFNTVWIEANVNKGYRKGTTAKIVTYETASRKGQPFEAVIAKYGIPNPASLHCTRELKAVPIRSYARSIGWKFNDYDTAIGIRSDEPERLDWNKAKKERLVYPFAQWVKIIKSDVNLFWSKQSFDLKLKSYEGNCDLCWKKGLRKLMTIVKDVPELADWYREMEQKYENFTPESRIEKAKPPYRFFRDNMTIDDIIEESKFPFQYARDESKDIDMFKQMTLWDVYLDGNNGCTESCEVF